MPKTSALQRQCQASLTSIVAQCLCVLVLIVLSVYLAMLLLEPLNLVGITTVPPGVLYVPYADPSSR